MKYLLKRMTNEVLDIIEIGLKVEYSKDNTFYYMDRTIYIPNQMKLSDEKVHHVCYLKSHYDFDLRTYDDVEFMYYIFSILHEVGHSFNTHDDTEEYIKAMITILSGGDLNCYREVPNEVEADVKAIEFWWDYSEEFIALKNKYKKLIKNF